MTNFEQIKNLDEVNAAIKEYADGAYDSVRLSTESILNRRYSDDYTDIISYFLRSSGGIEENFDFVISFHFPIYISLPIYFYEENIVVKVLNKEFAKCLLLERTPMSQSDFDGSFLISDCYTDYDPASLDDYAFGVFYESGKFTNSFVYCKGVTAQFIE